MSEVWKDIPGFDGYQASNLGRIRSKDRTIFQLSRHGLPIKRRLKGRVLKLQKSTNGYLFVALGKGNLERVHRLVAMAFIDGDSSLQVNHKNGIRTDNRAENLEWVSCSENHLHAYRELPRKKHRLARKVMLIKDQQIFQFDSCLDASKFLHVRPGSIASAALKGHRCRGYGVIYAT